MQKCTLDPEMCSRLQNLETEIEVCDEAGQTVGYFLPTDSYRQLIYAWVNAQVADEELEAARKGPDGVPLAEFLANLEKTCVTPSSGNGLP